MTGTHRSTTSDPEPGLFIAFGSALGMGVALVFGTATGIALGAAFGAAAGAVVGAAYQALRRRAHE